MASWLDDFTADNPVSSPNLIEVYYFYEYQHSQSHVLYLIYGSTGLVNKDGWSYGLG